ncbi:P-loop containing nucleoside triphosphate hydrolase protein [Tilletiaria anomala UBC 951]|uniref:Elongation factor 2 n=1 Tax=Tilletiaria anomala (strain ATCC 24038 / CBS 436.72 / UBC 951) TaxID=1037660 RepID=A0A066WH16_TILAU|nr:P-loop containing nucleoside triphosphate hydrolase protein [Tilletiaria anomala UBC 951]KDN53116.1 P-loop containing nucleoside triphosphate hydrolase protein [Tilletiaria anomala UBC 951]
MDDYDEFGNYIGALSDSDESEDDFQQPQRQQHVSPRIHDELPPLEGYGDAGAEEGDHEMDTAGPSMALMQVNEAASNAVILHEDKKYYPDASEVYGEGVETLVQEEDAQPITQPIIEPIKVRKFAIEESDLPPTRFERSFMMNLMNFPEMVRNVAVVGHLHHGKTSLMDMLVYETHKMEMDTDRPMRYTDSHLLERDRGVSIKSAPLSLVLQSTRGKSYLCNLIDTPGHTNFVDEVAAGCRLVDGVVLVVDVVEGVMCNTEAIIKHCIREDLPMVLVLNKLDRLILELRLPPTDAYFKIRHTLEEVNNAIASVSRNPDRRLSPERGNVVFACAQMGWAFTLGSFAKMYADTSSAAAAARRDAETGAGGGGLNVDAFAKRLWGNIWYNAESRNFTRKPADPSAPRSFVHFILEPLYKLYTQVLSSDSTALQKTLAKLDIHLKPAVFKVDVRPLLRIVLNHFLGPSTGLVDAISGHLPDAKEGAQRKLSRYYTGPQAGPLFDAMKAVDPDAPLVVYVSKLYATQDASEFRAFGRVVSGTARSGARVKVLGEGYSVDDEEDMVQATIEGVSVSETRYTVPAEGIPAGNLVLLAGVDASISKSATIVDAALEADQLHIFRPIAHMTQSVLKIAVEPLHPSELPKMLDGLRKVNKSYPLAVTKVEESGEHIILGTGELYLDCIMHDLRKLFSEVEIKVSDPTVKFSETVVETSAVKCYAQTPNKRNKLTIIAEPLEKGIAEDIESGKVSIRLPPKELGRYFVENHDWDILASRSIWAFGPEDNGPNILLDDTLPSEVDKTLLYSVKESIKQGFQWGAREGPLCDEPIRNVKFRILDSEIAQEPIYRGAGQVIPTSRRVCYSSFLLATPRLMEPMYAVEVQAPQECVAAVYTTLARRRGHVVRDIPKAGSPLYTVKAYVPVMDANGFETDLRTVTQGQAFCLQTFDHWSVVPGDPLDASIKLRPLEPAPPLGLARDFVLKTRRRKGLSDQIAVASYLDPEMVVALAASGYEL